MKSSYSPYLPAVDHIRALAATLVILQHSYLFIGHRFAERSGTALNVTASSPFHAMIIEGHTGVALFMVLSGFIFTHISYGKHVQYGPFMVNRVLRIYPLMCFLFIVGVVVQYPKFHVSDAWSVLAIPFQFKDPPSLWFVPEIWPFTALFWTIAPEFQFYLIFPVLLALVHWMGPSVLGILLICAIAGRAFLFVSGLYSGAELQWLAYWDIIGRIDQFLIGMAAAIVYKTSRVHLALLFPMALLAMPLLLFGLNRSGGFSTGEEWKLLWPTIEGAVWASFILGYLKFAVHLPEAFSSGLARVGEVSYSMYLVHTTIIAAVLRVGPVSFGFTPSVDAVLNGFFIVLPGTIAVSWVTFRLIERPFLRIRLPYLVASPQKQTHNA